MVSIAVAPRFCGQFIPTVFLFISLGFAQSPQQKPPPLIKPDLSQMQGVLAEKLESLHKLALEIPQRFENDPLKSAEAYGVLAQAYQAHNFLEAAEAAYLNSKALAPDDDRWSYYLGFIYLDQNKLEPALKSFRDVIEIIPNDTHALVQIGQILLDLDKPQEARESFEHALDVDPNIALAFYGLGEAFSALNDPKAAVENFEKALGLQPDADSIYYPLGLAYRKLGDREKAREYVEKRGETKVRMIDPRLNHLNNIVTLSKLDVAIAMAGDPNTPTRDLEGFVRTNLGARDGLEEYLIAALDDQKYNNESPDDFQLARLHFLIGSIQIAKQKDFEAGEQFEEAIKLHPDFPEAFKRLEGIYAREKNIEGIVDLYARVIENDPNNRDARFGRSKALYELGRAQDAIDDLRAVLETKPDDGRAHLRIAAIMVSENRNYQALQHFREAVKYELPTEEKVAGLADLGTLFMKLGKVDEAITSFEQALRLDPNQIQTEFNLASALAMVNRFGDAASHYDTVIKVQPDNTAALLGRAAAQVLAGQYDKAKLGLELAMAKVPDNMELTHLFARLLAMSPNEKLRDGERAAELALKVFTQNNSLIYAETYAMALAQAGRFEEAVSLQKALIGNAQRLKAEIILGRLKANLARYESQDTCCQDQSAGMILSKPVR